MSLLSSLFSSAVASSPVGAVATVGIEAASSIIDKFFPDKTQLEKDAAAQQLQVIMNEYNLANGQIEVNKIEAASTNWFVAGWRPYIGWICGTGLSYQFLLMPIANGLLSAFGSTHTGAFPQLDVATLTACLSGILGLGTLRTVEKHAAVESNR